MKKTILLLLTFSLLLTLGAFGAYADGAAFKLESCEADPGDEISVPISLVNNPGIISAEIEVVYDTEVLEWIGVQAGDYAGTVGDYDIGIGQSVAWFARDERTDIAQDGVLVTLSFKVKEETQAKSTQISVSYDEDNIFSADFNNVYFDVVPGVVTIKGEAELEPSFDTVRLELGGILNMRFYMEYPEVWDTANDKMVFTMNAMNPLEIPYSKHEEDEGHIYFACPVNAYRMADTIKAEYYHGGEMITSREYTVAQYLQAVVEAGGSSVDIAKATANYGHYIQPYLAEINGWEYGDLGKYTTMKLSYPDSLSPEASVGGDYQVYFHKDDEEKYAQYVEKVTFYLTLDSDTKINVKIYLKDPAANVMCSVNGTEQTPLGSADIRVVSMDGINAKALGQDYPFVCYINGEQVFTLNTSVLAFVNRVFNKSTTEQVEKDALHALYDYAQAAANYTPNA